MRFGILKSVIKPDMNEEERRSALQAAFVPRFLMDEREFEELIQEQMPEFSMIKRRSEREARRTRSESAREFMINYTLQSSLMNSDMGRKYNSLLDFSGTKMADAENQEIFRIFKSGTLKDKQNYVLWYAQTLLDRNPEEVYAMTDQELVDNADQVMKDAVFAMEIDNFITDQSFEWNDDQLAVLNQLKMKNGYLNRNRLRLEMISNPCYEAFSYEQMQKVYENKLHDAYSEDDRVELKDGGIADVFGNYLGSMDAAILVEQHHWYGVLEEQLAALGQTTMENLTCYSEKGELLKSVHSRAEEMRQGHSLLVMNPEGKMFSFVVEGHQLKSITREQFLQNDYSKSGKEADNIWNQLEAADPRLMKSSDQFKEMKEAMKKVKKELQTLTGSLSKKQTESLSTLIENLERTSDAYLTYKGREGKNRREQDRIDVAERIKQFAQEKKKLIQMTRTVKEEVFAEEEAFTGTSHWRSEEHQKMMGENLDIQNANLSTVERFDVFQELLERRFPPSDEGSCLQELQDEAITLQEGVRWTYKNGDSMDQKLDTIGELGNMTGTEAMKKCVAELIAIELIKNERNKTMMENAGKQEKKEIIAGDMEKQLKANKKDFIDSIEKLPLFQQQTSNMTADKFAQFLAGNGAKKFSSALKEYVQMVAAEQKKQNIDQENTNEKEEQNVNTQGNKEKEQGAVMK